MGFDIMNRKDNINQHPKKPPQSKIDELTIPYHWQAAETVKSTEKKDYRPEDDGKKDFVKMVKGVHTFSDGKFFKTVFVSGDDMVAEEKALREEMKEKMSAEIEELKTKELLRPDAVVCTRASGSGLGVSPSVKMPACRFIRLHPMRRPR